MRPVLLGLALVLLAARSAAGAPGVALAPDEQCILVQKDVGGDRWAINVSLSEATPFTLTGNVFRSGGGEPAFLWCDIRDVQGTPDDIAHALFTWACYGTTRCRPGDCPAWSFVANVTLPGSFFLPQ